MELKATSVLILVCFAIVILTSNEVDAIPSCCLNTKRIPKRMLRLVSRYKIQRRYGGCDIDALVLYIGNKRICADLKVLEKLEKLKKLNNHKPKRTLARTE